MDEKLYRKIIDELNTLIKGYDFIYVIAQIACEDYFISTKDYCPKPANEKLNENEFLFVLGLWIKNIDKESSISSFDDVLNATKRLRELLEQLHYTFLYIPQKTDSYSAEFPFKNVDGNWLKESIFYTGAGAYDLQMIQFIEPKYRYDREWILTNKYVDINIFMSFFIDIKRMMIKHRTNLIASLQKSAAKKTFSASDLFTINVIPLIRINPKYAQIIDEFSFPIEQPICVDINDIGDYNPISSKPIIRLDDDHIFIPYLPLLATALYETPYYWIGEDKDYYEHCGKDNRGKAAEEITHNLLARVFSKERTYKNVEIRKNSKAVLAEIDVLAIYGNIAIIVQVKSKRLTERSKKGDEASIQKDFLQAVKKAYEQAERSEKALLNKENKCYNKESQIDVSPIDTCIKLSVTLDFFPAVDNIAKRELGTQPQLLALSIFDLDMLTSYIPDALRLTEYFRYRSTHRGFLQTDNEACYLGFYLKNGFKDYDDKYTAVVIDPSAGLIMDQLMYKDLMNKHLPEFEVPEYGKKSKVGRNDPCPCGSGKKYKKCCGKL